MRVMMWLCMAGIATIAIGCSDGRNMGGANSGSQTHTANRPVDDTTGTNSGTTSSPAQTGSGSSTSGTPANSGSGGTGTSGAGGTAPAGK